MDKEDVAFHIGDRDLVCVVCGAEYKATEDNCLQVVKIKGSIHCNDWFEATFHCPNSVYHTTDEMFVAIPVT